MAKPLIMYHSIYGTTKKYAEWIAEELSGDLYEVQYVKAETLKDYDTIVLGCALYAGSIKGLHLIKSIKDKKIIIFTCGLGDASKTEKMKEIRQSIAKVITEPSLQNIHLFHLRGGIDYSKLSFIHKMMMWVVKKMILKKTYEAMSEDEKGIVESYGKAVDYTDRDSIAGIVSCGRSR